LENKDLIPFFGISRQYASIREEILHITDHVYRSGKVLDGPYTRAFEDEIAKRCNRQYAISVNSCTQGLIFALACVKNPGHVLVPAISFAATVNSVLMSKQEPLFVDVDDRALFDLETVDFSLTDVNPGAIMYANLFGNTLDYDRFRVMTEFFTGVKPLIIEDAAQSFGASYKGIPSGKMGDISVLSFDPTKNLPNYGSGGMILTDDFNVFSTVADMRDNGKLGQHTDMGTNSKMSESDCAQMMIKLQLFDKWQARRTEIANYYIDNLHPYVDIVMPNEHVQHAWHKFVILVDSRNKLKHYLETSKIETKIHYDIPLDSLHVAAQYKQFGAYSTECYHAHQYSKRTLSLPIYPELTDAEVERIVQTVKEFYH
jgi:dTDP-4-amino-4,6-dideoxygalactose transaminase